MRLGPGLLESIYEECLAYELTKHGLTVERQKRIDIQYEDLKLKAAFTANLIVNNKLLIELKSINEISPIHYAQTITYLKLTKIKLGLLINFNESLFKDGIKRVINGYIT